MFSLSVGEDEALSCYSYHVTAMGQIQEQKPIYWPSVTGHPDFELLVCDTISSLHKDL